MPVGHRFNVKLTISVPITCETPSQAVAQAETFIRHASVNQGLRDVQVLGGEAHRDY